jgi:hypothetical protein
MLPSSESLCWCIFRQFQVYSMAWRAAVLTDVILGFFVPLGKCWSSAINWKKKT